MNKKLIRGIIPELKNLLFFAAFFLGGHIMGQSVVSPVGTNLQTGENQLTFTVGETTTQTFQSGEVILTQGFHQSRLIITAINNTGSSDLKFSVGPNPTDDYLFLTFNTEITRDSRFILTDLQGSIIRQGSFQSETTRIPFLGLPTAAYILKVFIDNRQAPFTYKILKK
jgi:hypothetical protein